MSEPAIKYEDQKYYTVEDQLVSEYKQLSEKCTDIINKIKERKKHKQGG